MREQIFFLIFWPFLSNIYPEVKLLDHRTVVFSIFWRTFIVCHSGYTNLHSCKQCTKAPFSPHPHCRSLSLVFWDSHFNRWGGDSSLWFLFCISLMILMLNSLSYTCWLFVCLWKMSIQFLCPFEWDFCCCCYWVLWAWIWITYQIYSLQIFSLFLLPFHFIDCLLYSLLIFLCLALNFLFFFVPNPQDYGFRLWKFSTNFIRVLSSFHVQIILITWHNPLQTVPEFFPPGFRSCWEHPCHLTQKRSITLEYSFAHLYWTWGQEQSLLCNVYQRNWYLNSVLHIKCIWVS